MRTEPTAAFLCLFFRHYKMIDSTVNYFVSGRISLELPYYYFLSFFCLRLLPFFAIFLFHLILFRCAFSDFRRLVCLLNLLTF